MDKAMSTWTANGFHKNAPEEPNSKRSAIRRVVARKLSLYFTVFSAVCRQPTIDWALIMAT